MPNIEYTVMWNGQLRVLYEMGKVNRLTRELEQLGFEYRISQRVLNG